MERSQISRRHRSALASLFIMLLLPHTALALEYLYVQSLQANLMSEPRLNAPAVTSLVRGTRVELLESKAGWHKVQHEEQPGWMFGFFLAAHPPLDRVAPTITEAIDSGQARRRASAVVSAGATRGLTPRERARAHTEGLADYHALQTMETFSVTDAQVLRFVVAGIPE